MKKFAVACFDEFSRELKLEIVEETNGFLAAVKVISKGEKEEYNKEMIENCNSLDELQENWLGDEFWIEVKEIN